jgi:polar amino acid transport system permease protein
MDFINKVIELFNTQKYMDSIFEGLKTTLIISVLAALLGLVLGTIVAMVTIAKKTPWMQIPKFLCNLYITVIRGTPMALQLFIMAYVVFAIRGFPIIVTATLAFGINSGAYVAENIRAGILSVDIGQTEAGRALGLQGAITMLKIVIPQSIKNILPTLGNEFIVLIKETSVVSFIAVTDLTKAFRAIGDANYEYLIPYVMLALVYLVLVMLITVGIKIMERRFRRNERNA